jgi:hypothetical protein
MLKGNMDILIIVPHYSSVSLALLRPVPPLHALPIAQRKLLFRTVSFLPLLSGREEFLYALFECAVATTSSCLQSAIIPDCGNRPPVISNNRNPS